MAGLLETDPVKFSEVITSGRIIPGDTVVLLPGIYEPVSPGITGGGGHGKGVYRIKLNGTAVSPVTIKPLYPGTVRINGGVELLSGEASYIDFDGLEIAPTPTTRTFATSEEIDYPNSLYITSPGCNVRNCHVHDGKQIGIYGVRTCGFTGNVVGAHGYYTEDLARNRDYNIYTHNHSDGNITITNNVFYAPFGTWSIAMWSASTNNIKGYRANNNVMIDGGIIVGSDSGLMFDNVVNDNVSFNGSPCRRHIRLGAYGTGADIEVLRNYFVVVDGGVSIARHTFPVFKNNTVVMRLGATWRAMVYDPQDGAVPDIDSNSYFNQNEDYDFFGNDQAPINTLEGWQSAYGIDMNSAFACPAQPNDSVQIREMVESKKWSVSVFNWSNKQVVGVDMSAYVSGPCIVRNATDYINDVFEWSGEGELTLDMVNRTHTTPTAYDSPDVYAPSPFPTFGAFVIEVA